MTCGYFLQALPGSYRAASWPEDRLDAPESSDRTVSQLGSSTGQARAEHPRQPPSWRKQLPHIIAAFERSLQDLLSDVVLLLVDKVACLAEADLCLIATKTKDLRIFSKKRGHKCGHTPAEYNCPFFKITALLCTRREHQVLNSAIPGVHVLLLCKIRANKAWNIKFTWVRRILNMAFGVG